MLETRSQMFRAGVGAIITGADGKVLALERVDTPGAWQLPQGGLDVGEEPLEAVIREVREETGIRETALRLLSPEPRLLAYQLPENFRSKKTGRGQTQLWFIFAYQGADEAITLGDGKEFRAWQWLAMDELLAIVAPFRKDLYRELAEFLAKQQQSPG